MGQKKLVILFIFIGNRDFFQLNKYLQEMFEFIREISL